MMLFPLGLVARTFDIPTATIVLIVATLFYSIFYLSVTDQYSQKISESPEFKESLSRRWELVSEYCQLKLSAETCENFRKNSNSALLLTPKAMRKVLTSHLKENGASRSELRSLLEFAFDDKNFEVNKLKLSDLAWGGYKTAEIKLDQIKRNTQVQLGLVSQASFSFSRLFRAQFLHSGWSHLIFNLLFFLLIAIPVEQRIGIIGFSVVYFTGGLFGLGLDLFFNKSADTIIVGASANIFAIAGAFLVLFWKFKVRVWVNFMLVLNRIVQIPVLWFFLLWLVLQEVIGLLQGGSNVAHLAHLGGMLMGGGVAFLLTQYFSEKLAIDMIFPYESGFQKKIKATSNQMEKLRMYNQWLNYNPENYPAYRLAMGTFYELIQAGESLNTQALKEFSDRHFQGGVSHFLKSKDQEVFDSMPLSIRVSAMTKNLDPKELLEFGNFLLQNQKHWTAMRVFDIFLDLHSQSSRAEQVRRLIEQLMISNEIKQLNQNIMTEFLQHNQRSFVAQLILRSRQVA